MYHKIRIGNCYWFSSLLNGQYTHANGKQCIQDFSTIFFLKPYIPNWNVLCYEFLFFFSLHKNYTYGRCNVDSSDIMAQFSNGKYYVWIQSRYMIQCYVHYEAIPFIYSNLGIKTTNQTLTMLCRPKMVLNKKYQELVFCGIVHLR